MQSSIGIFIARTLKSICVSILTKTRPSLLLATTVLALSQLVCKIFNMFYRASEQSDGSGLGLYIVKNAIEKLGGQIQVRSKIGEGTSFIITLPNHSQE
ncbi:MAG: HAMP domain-containing sensor histidine kinase [Cyclobacteriaceae bacterium]